MDCTDNYIELKRHLDAMARVAGALIGLPIVEVASGYESQALQCDDGLPRTFERLLAASIGVDPCGKPAIRVKFIDSCVPQINCIIGPEQDILNQIFAYEPTTKTFALVLNKSTA